MFDTQSLYHLLMLIHSGFTMLIKLLDLKKNIKTFTLTKINKCYRNIVYC